MGTIWMQFKELIFQFLLMIESVVGDWGLAIIVLTVLVQARSHASDHQADEVDV